MSGFLDWILDLDTLSAGAEDVRFALEREVPLYLWVGAAGAALLIGWWSYRRLAGPSALRWTLGLVRAALLLLIALLVAGPSMERREETTERDWVLVLIDRSQSLEVADAGDGARATRDEQLRAALESARESIAALGQDREVRWFGFGESAYELEAGEDGLPELGEPSGRRTDLSGAMATALQRATARPVAGVLVISDGRAAPAPGRNDLRRLLSAGTPVHVAPLGSAGTSTDVAVTSVSAPEAAYKDDPTPVRVELTVLGDADALASGELRLLDVATDEVLERRRVELPPGRAEATLTHRAEAEGAARWRVEFVPDQADLIESNNAGAASLAIVDRPLRALYLDGSPRWEQRYLRNLLIREASVESSNLMLAPDRRYLQEGDVELATLPSSPEEWSRYDLVILGDLDPGVLTAAQLEQIRLFVAEDGGGLVWIGGESYTPDAWWSTPLGALLPMTPTRAATEPIGAPVQVRPTPEAERLGVLRLMDENEAGWPAELVDPMTGWSALHWAQRVEATALKPSAAALAVAGAPGETPTWPLVVTMRYGAGRIVYVATDEIWRWRYGRGEIFYERFWVQLARLLGRERLTRGDAGFSIQASTDAADVGDPVTVTLELEDQALLERAPEVVRVRAELTDRGIGVQGDAEFELTRSESNARRFTGVWTPPAAGQWTLRPADPSLATRGPGGSTELEARVPGGELADPRPDHALLASLAETTGGRVIRPEALAELGDPGVLPSRAVRRVIVERETLWDTPLALALLLALAGAEWIGRRLMRLL